MVSVNTTLGSKTEGLHPILKPEGTGEDPQRLYQVIAANSLINLEKFVNNEIRHGWSVTGGLAIYAIPSKEMLAPPESVFVQAMIKCPTGK
jgi:hypothetical protein